MKLVGAPPDSYFDFSRLNFQTPMKGSFVVTAVAAGRGVRDTAAGLAGRDAVWGIATTLDESTRIAIGSIKACRDLRMSHLRAWGARFQRRPKRRSLQLTLGEAAASQVFASAASASGEVRLQADRPIERYFTEYFVNAPPA